MNTQQCLHLGTKPWTSTVMVAGREEEVAATGGHGRRQRWRAAGPSGGRKKVLFLRRVLKETMTPSKAPQPVRCAERQGRNTLTGCLRRPSKTEPCSS